MVSDLVDDTFTEWYLNEIGYDVTFQYTATNLQGDEMDYDRPLGLIFNTDANIYLKIWDLQRATDL